MVTGQIESVPSDINFGTHLLRLQTWEAQGSFGSKCEYSVRVDAVAGDCQVTLGIGGNRRSTGED